MPNITLFLGNPVYQALPDDLRGMNLTVEVSKRGDVHFLRGKGVPGGFWMENGFSAVRKGPKPGKHRNRADGEQEARPPHWMIR